MKKRSPADPEDFRMSFGDHIEELRRRLIYALLGVGIAIVITAYYGRPLIAWLYTPLAVVQREAGLPTQTYTRSAMAGFTVYMKVVIFGALILAAPWIFYQLWKFVQAGLYAAERKAVMWLVSLSSLMTVLGLVFMYYVFLPAALAFFVFWTTSYPIAAGDSDYFRWVTSKFVRLNDQFMSKPDTSVPTGGATTATSQPAPPPTTAPATTAPAAATAPADTAPAATAPAATASAPASTAPAAIAPTTAPAAAMLPARRIPLIVPRYDRDPPEPVEGEVWYNTRLSEIRIVEKGQIRVFSLSAPTMMMPLIDPSDYINQVALLGLIVVLIFQVPVVMAFLGMVGIGNPDWLAKRRKLLIFGFFLAAVFLTPSQDIFSNVALPLLMWFLFEFGLVLMRFFARGRAKRIAAEEAAAAAEETDQVM